MTPAVLGVDPGLKGAFTFVSDDEVKVFATPVLDVEINKKKKRVLDRHRLDRLVSDLRDLTTVAFVEEVHAMPMQGTVSMFSFGNVYGSILQALVSKHFVVHHVQPRQWRTALRVRGNKKDKGASILRASELMPQYAHLWGESDHNIAESALIACYGRQQLINGTPYQARRRLPSAKASKP